MIASPTTSPNCNDVITSCADALRVADLVIESLKKERKIQSDIIIVKDERIKDLEAWYRQPEILIPLGVIIGIGLRK